MIFSRHQPETARIRTRDGEKHVAIETVFDPTRGEALLICDCALLCAEIYGHTKENISPTNSRVKHSSWKEFTPDLKGVKRPRGRWVIGDLGFKIYISKKEDGTPLGVLVFRGTRGLNFGDWFSNIRWATRFIPGTWDQYREAQALVTHVIGSLRTELGPEGKIISTGHSLGGGLAQLAAYATPEISVVYAFNSSPVTAYFSVDRKIREESSKELRILRLYEHGEVLAYLRLGLRLAYPLHPADPEITEIRFNFGNGNPASDHSMERFATGFHSYKAHPM